MLGNGTADGNLTMTVVGTLEMASTSRGAGPSAAMAIQLTEKAWKHCCKSNADTPIISRFTKVRHFGGVESQTSVCCWESRGGIVTSSKWPSSPLS